MKGDEIVGTDSEIHQNLKRYAIIQEIFESSVPAFQTIIFVLKFLLQPAPSLTLV